jgi:Aspartyl protease
VPPSSTPPALKVAVVIPTLIASLASCASQQTTPVSQPTVIPLSFFGADSLPMLQIELGGRRLPFILDFGAGITVVSKQLCDTLGCSPAGRMAGFRHTGEVLELSLVSLPALKLGPIGRTQLPGAVMDLTAWQQVTPVAGVLSLQLLEHTPFELDLPNRRLILNPAPSARKAANTSPAHVALVRQHPATVEIYVPIFLAGQRLGWAQLDTGSPQTYLHAWWKPLLRQHGHKLYAREQQSWTGRRDSVEYWSVHGLALLDPVATRDSATVEVGAIVPDAVIGLDWLRRGVLSCNLDAQWCSFTRTQ